MDDTVVRVLLIEDNAENTAAIRECLAGAGNVRIELACTKSVSAGLARLTENGCDVILLGLNLRSNVGVDALHQVYRQSPDVPVVVLTGPDSDKLAGEAVRTGVIEHLVKGPVDTHSLVLSIRYAMERSRRGRAEDALANERQLLQQLLESQERDRKLIAYEIHDGFVQQAAGALLHLQAVPELRAQDTAEAEKSLDLGTQLLSGSIREARRIIGGLRPPVLDEARIVAAIEYVISETEKHGGPTIEFSHDVPFDRLPAPLETAVFRIVQEALANATRHSQSKKVRIGLEQSNGYLRINVQDWGIGFDPTEVKEDRFGLQGIRERARLLGGRSTIDSTLGKGTRVLVELPLSGLQ